jgi:argininosuccinate lyase
VRGKAGTAIGALVSLLTIVKGLPLGYNKDMQEDKTSWFSLLDTSQQSVEILTDLVREMLPMKANMNDAATGSHVIATELANYLVRKGLPFRNAHYAVGSLVKLADELGRDVSELDLETMQGACSLFQPDVRDITAQTMVVAKNSVGSCGTEAHARLMAELKTMLSE